MHSIFIKIAEVNTISIEAYLATELNSTNIVCENSKLVSMWAVLGSNDFFSLSGISWEDGTRLGYFRAVSSPDCNYKGAVL